LPPRFSEARLALHQIAFFAVSPARYATDAKMGLRASPGGFGTPEFNGRVARVEGNTLVHEQEGNVASQTISTVRAAASFFGVEYRDDWFDGFRDPLSPVDPDEVLEVDDAAARAVGQWFNFGFTVLEKLRSHGGDGDDASEPQLWPEHFDPAIEMGDGGQGRRASFGASPGDDGHREPYVYVSAWGDIDRSHPYWNDETFNGSSLGYSALADAGEPVETAVDFLLLGHGILHAG
jgi:hypothetical protein